MKTFFTPIALILLIVALFEIWSCEKSKAPSPLLNCNSLADTTQIRYVADTLFDPKSIQIIVVQNCSYQSGCHEQGSTNGDFTTYQGIKARADDGSLYQRVVAQRDMPPAFAGFTLSDCQIKEFYLWIQEGAPQY